MTEVLRILNQIEHGDPSASEDLLPLVYDELRRLARVWFAAEKDGQTLQPTALVHEAYLRLVNSDSDSRWDSRGHFFVAAATAMRRILIENARRKGRLKHGGGLQKTFLETATAELSTDKLDLLGLEEALSEFELEYPTRATVLQLRFFTGLSYAEIAASLGLSERTVKRYWRFARAWLHKRLIK